MRTPVHQPRPRLSVPPWVSPILLFAFLLSSTFAIVARIPASDAGTPPGRADQAPGVAAVAPPAPAAPQRLGLAFVPNQGQTDGPVRFVVRGAGGTLFFTPSEAVLALPDPSIPLSSTVVRLRYQGANATPTLQAGTPLPGVVNYFVGNDTARWRTNLPTYADISYQQLYPGIDMRYTGTDGQLKSTYIVAAGASPGQIRWHYLGSKDVSVDTATGDLVVTLVTLGRNRPDRTLRESAPVAWQERNGQREPVSVQYAVAANRSVSFVLGSYDAAQPLYIDPTLTYSTYLGGSGTDQGEGIAVDASGNTYVTGFTASSTTFPVQNPLYTYAGSTDAFVTKLSADGQTLLYSTYLGGSSSDKAHGIAVDSTGSVVVVGETQSSSFPRQGAYDTSYGGGTDAFVTRLNPAGNGLLYSTYLGGSSEDQALGVTIDGSNTVNVTGFTKGGFPTRNAYDTSYNNGADAFVTTLNTGTTGAASLLYSTYLGGGSDDKGTSIARDTSGNVYITGYAAAGFPMLNAYDNTYGGSVDVVVTKVNPAAIGAASLLYSTYLGANGEERGLGIAVDSANTAYVTGYTTSDTFPVLNAAQPTRAGDKDAFVTRINPSLTGTASLLYATFFGSTNEEQGLSIAAGLLNRVYITGLTRSNTLPLTLPVQPTFGGGTCSAQPCSDAFAMQLDVAGKGVLYATYLGGNSDDEGHGIAVDGSQFAYVTGFTLSSNFPVASPRQGTRNGTYSDVFVTKIDSTTVLPTATPTLNPYPNAPTATQTDTPLPTATPLSYPPPATPTPGSLAPVPLSAQTNFVYLPLAGPDFRPPPPDAPPPPRVVASFYIQLIDFRRAYSLGKLAGQNDANVPGTQNSIVVLQFGEPYFDATTNAYGTTIYGGWNPAKFAFTDDILNYAKEFAKGYYAGALADTTSRVTVAVGTTNGGSNVTAAHAQAWANMVNSFESWLTTTGYASQVSAAGSGDIEVDFSIPATARTWINAYTAAATTTAFYYFGDAAGCPETGDGSTNGTCVGRRYTWTQADIWELAWGGTANSTRRPLAQIYNASQAKQWYQIVLYGIVSQANAARPKMLIEGVGTQYEACQQKPPCSGTDYDSATAWTQLWQELNQNDRRTAQTPPYATDIEYTVKVALP